VKAGSGKSAHAAQRGALKAPTVYHFKNLLGDEGGRAIQGWQISVGGRPYRAEKNCRGGIHRSAEDFNTGREKNARKNLVRRKKFLSRGYLIFGSARDCKQSEQIAARFWKNPFRKWRKQTRRRQTEQMRPANSSSRAAQIEH